MDAEYQRVTRCSVRLSVSLGAVTYPQHPWSQRFKRMVCESSHIVCLHKLQITDRSAMMIACVAQINSPRRFVRVV